MNPNQTPAGSASAGDSTHLSPETSASRPSELDKPLPSLPLEATEPLTQDEERLHTARTISPSFKRKLSIESHAPDSDGDAAVDKPDTPRETSKKSRTSFIQGPAGREVAPSPDATFSSGLPTLNSNTCDSQPRPDRASSIENNETVSSSSKPPPAPTTAPPTDPSHPNQHDSSDGEDHSDRKDSGYSSPAAEQDLHRHTWLTGHSLGVDPGPHHGRCNNPYHIQEDTEGPRPFYEWWCKHCDPRVCARCKIQIDQGGHACPWLSKEMRRM
ncbi:hypothetical protein LTR97_011921 [Elasticomyces elasticus]|uniref:Uncharacterized protein n=1 Tax=Elasticomyces elasticus TaxID=574655 RepID=A0AAN7ZKT1_9PEZI|nr:hypothetical protein LTR97_011921 [Elasticomyces elasticus]